MTTIYNSSKKVIFVHVHKCAGTAITDALEGASVKESPGWKSPREEADKAKRIMVENNALIESSFSAPEHFRAIDMKAYLGAKQYESHFSFAISRNPWARLASWYYFLRENPKKSQSKIARNLTMEDFIKYSIDHFYLPQYHWVTNAKGDVIVDKIIKLENLSNKWSEITKKISDKAINLREINASSNTKDPRPNPFSHVTTETLDKFIEAYKKDFELLGYSSDKPDHLNVNKKTKAFDKIWEDEVAGERNFDNLCTKHNVSAGEYHLYRELKSKSFYAGHNKTRSSVSVVDTSKVKFLSDKIVKQKIALEKAQKANAVLRKKLKNFLGEP